MVGPAGLQSTGYVTRISPGSNNPVVKGVKAQQLKSPGELASCPRELLRKVDAELRVLAGDFLMRGPAQCGPAAMATDHARYR